MAAVGAAEIGDLSLGQVAVRQNDEVIGRVEQAGATPIGLDDASLVAIAQHDPVADLVGAAEIEGDAREDVCSVFCRARPRMMANTPDVAIKVPTGTLKT